MELTLSFSIIRRASRFLEMVDGDLIGLPGALVEQRAVRLDFSRLFRENAGSLVIRTSSLVLAIYGF